MDRASSLRPVVARISAPSPVPYVAPGADALRSPGWLTPDEQRELAELKARDAFTRQAEQEQIAVGGVYVKPGAGREYRMGADGRRYLVSGGVYYDTRPVPGSPEATIKKAQVIQRAAIAPANPSPADRRVAAMAARMEYLARQELARQRDEAARKAAERSRQGSVNLTA